MNFEWLFSLWYRLTLSLHYAMFSMTNSVWNYFYFSKARLYNNFQFNFLKWLSLFLISENVKSPIKQTSPRMSEVLQALSFGCFVRRHHTSYGNDSKSSHFLLNKCITVRWKILRFTNGSHGIYYSAVQCTIENRQKFFFIFIKEQVTMTSRALLVNLYSAEGEHGRDHISRICFSNSTIASLWSEIWSSCAEVLACNFAISSFCLEISSSRVSIRSTHPIEQ